MTKEGCLFSKDIFKSFGNDSGGPCNGKQYSDLNLNESYKTPVLTSAQLFSNSNNNKYFDLTVSDNSEGKRKLQDWNKSSSLCLNSLKVNDKTEKDETEKRWKQRSSTSNATNNITLSLHIAAYENSIETAASDSSFVSKVDELKKGKSYSDKQIIISCFTFQNPFEFPRQQKGGRTKHPEIMGYRSSQRIVNPNKPSSSNNAPSLNVITQASSPQIPNEIVQNGSDSIVCLLSKN
uniref:Uncharacterized protein n=1 Tax=Panagrolaimus sp. PS1159 TaxID=55785 RepID=A0AC35FJA7_9BILA